MVITSLLWTTSTWTIRPTLGDQISALRGNMQVRVMSQHLYLPHLAGRDVHDEIVHSHLPDHRLFLMKCPSLCTGRYFPKPNLGFEVTAQHIQRCPRSLEWHGKKWLSPYFSKEGYRCIQWPPSDRSSLTGATVPRVRKKLEEGRIRCKSSSSSRHTIRSSEELHWFAIKLMEVLHGRVGKTLVEAERNLLGCTHRPPFFHATLRSFRERKGKSPA